MDFWTKFAGLGRRHPSRRCLTPTLILFVSGPLGPRCTYMEYRLFGNGVDMEGVQEEVSASLKILKFLIRLV